MSRISDILDADKYDPNAQPLSRVEALLQEMIAQGGSGGKATVDKVVVDELPTTDIDDGAIYLIPGENPTEGNKYDEYVHTPNGWELISSADIGEMGEDVINNLWSD